MTEVTPRRHLVAHDLLELLDLREAAVFLARPDQPSVDPDLEHAAGVVGDERDRAELLGEGRKQFLPHPGGPEQPVAKPAIGYRDIWTRTHAKTSHFTRQRATPFCHYSAIPIRPCSLTQFADK